MDLKRLAEPFPAEDIEWRILQAGVKNGKPWGKCVAYVTNRAIMERLDDVCGPQNWCNEFVQGPGGGVLCGISIKCEGEWVRKWDGAENTDLEQVKGGLSGAMKRAAVQWGCGRYLYRLDEGWAVFEDNGPYSVKIEGQFYRWSPPSLPAWALPKDAHAAALEYIRDAAALCAPNVTLVLDGERRAVQAATKEAWPTLKRDREAALKFAAAVAEATGETFNP